MAERELPTWLVHTATSQRYPIYSRAFASDTLPGPIGPLTAGITWVPGVLEGWRDAFVDVGAFEMSELTAEAINPVGAVITGHAYVNHSLLQVLAVRTGVGHEVAEYLLGAARPGAPVEMVQPIDVDESATERVQARLDTIAAARQVPALDANTQLANELRAARPELSELDEGELLDRAQSLTGHVRSMVNDLVSLGVLLSPAIERLHAVAPALVLPMIGIGGDAEQTHPASVLWRLSRLREGSDEFVDQFLDFLRDFGSRGPQAWDPMRPSFETDPQMAMSLIEQMRGVGAERSPSARLARVIDGRERALEAALRAVRGDEQAIDALVVGQATALRLQLWRDDARVNCLRAINEQRVALLELARRHLDDPGELAMLSIDELAQFAEAPGTRAAETAGRRAGFEQLELRQPPFFVDSGAGMPTVDELPLRSPAELGDDATASALEAGADIVGDPGAPGAAVGVARIVESPHDTDDFEVGDVLVAESLDRSLASLLFAAGAVVCGDQEAHSYASMVSRELGIPCVVGLRGCTRRIADGEAIYVDGTAGTVRRG
ncbi:MAG: PEP-utilizing enzyme [Actinomycetota bacterium]